MVRPRGRTRRVEPRFDECGLLPPGDYSLTFTDLRESVTGRGTGQLWDVHQLASGKLQRELNRRDPLSRRVSTPTGDRRAEGNRSRCPRASGGDVIRSERDYQQAVARLEQDREVIQQQQARLRELGIEGEELERALHPALSFHDQLREEVETYERIKRGELEPLYDLANIGRLLIGARIAMNLTQREVAERLGVSESVVSRDERNEYHGVTVDKAQRVLEALGIRVKLEVEDPILTAA